MIELTNREAARKPLFLDTFRMNTANHVPQGHWRHVHDLHYRRTEPRYRQELDRLACNSAIDNLPVADATLRDRLIGTGAWGADHPGAAFAIIRGSRTVLDRDHHSAAANKRIPA